MLDPLESSIKQCKRHFLAAAVFSAFVNVLYIAPTLYMLQVYDRVVPTHGLTTLLLLTFVLLFALGTLALIDRVRSRLLVRAGVQIDTLSAAAVLDATFGRPDLPIARQALREFDDLRQTLTGQGVVALFDAPWTPIYTLICFILNPWIGALSLAGTLIIPLIAWRSAAATRDRLQSAHAAANDAYAGQDAMIGSAEVVRALGMRRALVARQMRRREVALRLQTEAGFAAGGYLTATKFFRLSLQSLALGLGAWLAVDNQISGGAIFASSFLIARSLAPIEQLVAAWRPIQEARASLRDLRSLLQGERDVVSTLLPPPTGALRLDGVTVLSPTRTDAIVDAVSFEARPGEVVAIVGPSGSGKSTLVRVIAGAIRPFRGSVRFDGADQSDWDPERLARFIGYVPQEASLFAGTVKENIARFASELDGDAAEIDAAAVRAAQSVGAHGPILSLPGGYDYVLGPGGRGLSAGQMQRVALARAAYGSPAVLILDEPNAHLDAEGDAALLTALRALKEAGATVLVVSHKPSLLPVVDRILVLRQGRVELFGSRDQVLPKILPQSVRRVRSQEAV